MFLLYCIVAYLNYLHEKLQPTGSNVKGLIQESIHIVHDNNKNNNNNCTGTCVLNPASKLQGILFL